MFDIDIERCACGGQSKVIVAIEAPAVIARILTHLNLPARAPPRIRSLIRKHDNGSAAEPTNSLGPRLRTALNLRQTMPFATVWIQKVAETEKFSSSYRAVDRSERWRYSGMEHKASFEKPIRNDNRPVLQRRGEDP